MSEDVEGAALRSWFSTNQQNFTIDGQPCWPDGIACDAGANQAPQSSYLHDAYLELKVSDTTSAAKGMLGLS